MAEIVKPYKPKSMKDDMHHGLVARAFLHMGDLDRRLEEFAKVHDVNSPGFGMGRVGPVEILEQWIDIAHAFGQT